jgi:hypothetical protein
MNWIILELGNGMFKRLVKNILIQIAIIAYFVFIISFSFLMAYDNKLKERRVKCETAGGYYATDIGCLKKELLYEEETWIKLK